MQPVRCARLAVHAALLVPLILCGDAQAAGVYRTVEIEGLRIGIDADWVMQTAPGYLPVRLDITNLSEARVIQILERGTRFTSPYFPALGRPTGLRYSHGSMTVRREVTLARGARIRFALTVPVFATSENFQFEVREEGALLASLGSMGLQSSLPPAEAGALLIAAPSSPLAARAAGWVRPVVSPAAARMMTTPPGAAAYKSPPLDLVLEPARVPATWLAFTSLRAVVLGTHDWDALTREQQDALRSWVACGGDLLIVDGEVPRAFHTAAPGAVPAGVGAVPFFLGHVHRVQSADLDASGLEMTLTGLMSLRDANWSLPANRAAGWNASGTRGFRQPIDGVGTVRARVYLSILLLFSLLIGPVNYLFLHRHRRQALIVVTTPILAVLFLVVLGGYVVIGEGFGLHLRSATLTVLDQSRQAAATRASVSMYAAGRTPSAGLQFSRETAVFPLGGVASNEDLHLNLTNAQEFSSGLVRARTPVNFETASFRTARERLVVTRTAEGLQVVNGLGGTVRQLLVFAGDRPYRLPSPLDAQGRATLAPSATSQMVLDPLHPMVSRFDGVMTRQPAGSYLAVLDRSPFWDPGAERTDERGSLHVVLGFLEQVP